MDSADLRNPSFGLVLACQDVSLGETSIDTRVCFNFETQQISLTWPLARIELFTARDGGGLKCSHATLPFGSFRDQLVKDFCATEREVSSLRQTSDCSSFSWS